MCGPPKPQRNMLAIAALEKRPPRDHPWRRVKAVADAASVPPERQLKASLQIAQYSVRSERAFCKGLAYNLPCRWFPGLDLPERSFDATVFTKNRARLPAHDADQALFDEVVWTPDREKLLSDEHSAWTGSCPTGRPTHLSHLTVNESVDPSYA